MKNSYRELLKKYYLYFLYSLLGILSLVLWNKWSIENPSVPTVTALQGPGGLPEAPPQGVAPNASSGGITPVDNASMMQGMFLNPTPERTIHIKTDVLEVEVDTLGGALVRGKLLQYPVSIENTKNPVAILSSDPNQYYVAESGLISVTDKATPAPIQYESAQKDYVLAPDKNELSVVLKGKNPEGLEVTHTLTFRRGHYDVNVEYSIHNPLTTPWVGSVYGQITRLNVSASHGFFNYRTYTGGAVSTPENPYQQLKNVATTPLNLNAHGGWIAMQEHYFLSAWVPPQQQLNHFYSFSRVTNLPGAPTIETVGLALPQLNITPGAQVTSQATFFVGPQIEKILSAVAPHLDLTVDYGWLWLVSKAILWLMERMHSILGNWGVAIIATTLVIKLIFFKFSEASFRSMAKMRDLQPRIEALKARCGDDKQKFAVGMQELYKKEKINPLGGCLPVLVQFPIFFALYYVLIASVQLRQAPFLFWIQDLSLRDPHYVLPILTGLSMFALQKLSPPPPDPAQAKVMMLLPLIMSVFFLQAPAGLALYFLTNNCAQFLQQWWFMKSHAKSTANG